MRVYHEAAVSSVGSILQQGMKRTSRGEKGDATTIVKTDNLIDDCRSKEQQKAGLSRDNNLYAYVGTDNFIVDITDGSHVAIDRYSKIGTQVLLELTVDQTRAFVSDLDKYDAIRRGVDEGLDDATLQAWSREYWNSMIQLDQFHIGAIFRPEIMITYDIAPENIRIVQ